MKPRSRRRQRCPTTHDLRHLYGAMPGRPHLAAITIEEPGGLLSSDDATLVTGGHPRGAPEWLPPTRPTIIVAQSVRGDPLGKMFARHQVSPVRYMAGRSYQELHTVAEIGRIGTTDPARPYIQGGRVVELVCDRQRAAARRLRSLDAAIIRYLGTLGLLIIRTVLIDCQPLVVAGERTEADKWTRGFLFNASLTMIAIKLGMATANLRDEDDQVLAAHRAAPKP